MGTRIVALALLTGLLFSLAVSGCGDNPSGGRGAQSVKTENFNPNNDLQNYNMRLGLDRYKNLGGYFRDRDGDMNSKYDRENGLDGWDQDGVNRWSDYQSNVQTQNAHVNTELQWSKEISDSVAALNEVRAANVLAAGHNAYVGLTIEHGYPGLSPALNKQIADKVRKMNPAVQNVYISSSSEFAQTLGGYAEQLRNGVRADRLLTDFNAAVREAFPAGTPSS